MMGEDQLGKLPLEAVLPVIERLGSGSRDDWADRMSMTPHVIYRAFNPNKTERDYFISFGKVPELCVAMRSGLLLRWANARYAYLKAQAGLDFSEPTDIADSFRKLARLAKEVGEYSNCLEKAAEDGELSSKERHQLKRELADVIQVATESLQGLEAIDEKEESRIR